MMSRSVVEPDRNRFSMRVKSFNAGELLHKGQRFFQRSTIHFHNAGATLELVRTESGKRSSRSAGGQGVARAGQKITDRHRGKIADIHGTRVAHLGQPKVFLISYQRQVLGSEIIDQAHAFGHVFHVQQKGALTQHLVDDFRAGERWNP